ncbi:MAG: hypothetical protein JOY78_03355 [Pseudonocardia sp.]|nr:hypothetical protein [Pseudonocardia sp.]
MTGTQRGRLRIPPTRVCAVPGRRSTRRIPPSGQRAASAGGVDAAALLRRRTGVLTMVNPTARCVAPAALMRPSGRRAKVVRIRRGASVARPSRLRAAVAASMARTCRRGAAVAG